MQMQSREVDVRSRMEELRLVCEREIPIQQQRLDASVIAAAQILDSAKSRAQQTLHLQEKLGKLRAELREAEDALVKALAVKTRKEAKRMATVDSIAASKAGTEELKRILEDQRVRRDECAAIISQQSEVLKGCDEKHNQNREHREQIEEAFSWYNKVLGFRIECGHGVKFIFTNVNPENPNEQYSFIIRHENEIYSLLDCEPHLSDTKELVNELNKSNGLFRFVRKMREKFQEAGKSGLPHSAITLDQDSTTISLSAPISIVSSDNEIETPAKEKGYRHGESERNSRTVSKGIRRAKSPGSSPFLRRSPRFMVNAHKS